AVTRKGDLSKSGRTRFLERDLVSVAPAHRGCCQPKRVDATAVTQGGSRMSRHRDISNMTLAEYAVTFYLSDPGALTPRATIERCGSLGPFLLQFGNVTIAETITPAMAESFAESHTTRAVCAAERLMRHLLNRGLIASNPFSAPTAPPADWSG